jgi:hypothetical protein
MSEPGESADEVVSAAIDSDSELNAIRAVLSALVPLKREGRTRVLDYVLKRLGMQGDQITQTPGIAPTGAAGAPELPGVQRGADIRSLTKEKSPGSANEMAALVAYYLSEIAPEGTRKQAINTEDIKAYFKQAPFKLPSRPAQTLLNAKNAGYFESLGGGQYKLNPVGYNLVVHSLPAGGAATKPRIANRRTGRRRK